ncbi:MAG: hypothetical protein AAB345_02095 [Patescibacteria group bacterium]
MGSRMRYWSNAKSVAVTVAEDRRADQLARIKKALAKIDKMTGNRGRRIGLDLEDAVVVLEMMVKEPKRFMKELMAISLKHDKYGNHGGFV